MTAKAASNADNGSRGRSSRFLIESALMVALIAGGVIALVDTKVISDIEQLFDDVAVAYHTPAVAESHPRIAVVAIDDDTIETLPARSPINRRFLADLLTLIDGSGAIAVGVDVIIFEPAYDRSDDEYLAATLRTLKTPVVLATALFDGKREPLVPVIAETGVQTTLVNLPVNKEDRTLRHFKTAFADENGDLHTTMAADLARYAGAEVGSSTDIQLIDWFGQPGWQNRPKEVGGGFEGTNPIATYSAQLLLKMPPMAHAFLKNKVVLVGATFAGSHDFLRTPFAQRGAGEESFPGVYGHAQIAAQLMDNRARKLPPRYTESFLVLLAVIIGLLLALLRVPAIIPFALGLLLPLAWVVGVFYLRRHTGLNIPAVPPALGIGLSLATFALFRARRFDHASRVAARALNSYLPPALARQVVNDPSLLQLGGEPRELTILFTDIAGFTSYSESADPHEVVTLLNIYLDNMAEIVLDHNGTLDKYIGDAVMAFFGAPVAIAGHSELAISCAMKMDEYGRQFAAEHGLKTRIGVHTGTVIVGNIGGEQRFDYTVIGDAVNTAARLEGANKAFKATDRDDRVYTTLCISGDTVAHYNSLPRDQLTGELSGLNLTGDDMRRNPDGATLRRIGKIRVKGREAALDVFSSVPEGFSPEDLDSYSSALDLIELGQHDEAGKILQRLYNEDDLSAYQLERCNVGEGPILTLTEK